MSEMNFVLVLALVTFGLVVLWMWRTKRQAVKGLPKSHRLRSDSSDSEESNNR